MQAALFLGTVVVVGLIVADWLAFRRSTEAAISYGVAVGRRHETLLLRREQFDAAGILTLPCGKACLFMDQHAILLQPDMKRLGVPCRTAWPLKGAVHYAALGEPAPVTLMKRMPWSSALLTALWFLTVALGLLAYLISYILAGGFSSASGAFLAIALSGLGLLVLLFGMVIVVAAYRLEDKRLMAVYEEFRAAHAR
jgi:hypothetical protein